VLGNVIEVLSGEKIDAFLQSRILQPLGMDDTSYLVPTAKYPRAVAVNARGADGKFGERPMPATLPANVACDGTSVEVVASGWRDMPLATKSRNHEEEVVVGNHISSSCLRVFVVAFIRTLPAEFRADSSPTVPSGSSSPATRSLGTTRRTHDRAPRRSESFRKVLRRYMDVTGQQLRPRPAGRTRRRASRRSKPGPKRAR
jgi:CubicO group peptidase (beta-lactamase class C family)